MSIDLFTTGAYFRAGGGNIERPQDQKPVISWASWNLDNGTDPPQHGAGIAAFAKARSDWRAANIAEFPWLHCRSMADVKRLMQAGQDFGSPAIGLNIEDVAKDFTAHGVSLQDIAQQLASWTKPIHMATLCWVQNGQGWSALKRCVAALEFFIDEAPSCADFDGCIQHAFDEGLTQVTYMAKTKLPPITYDLSICHSLYTGDDIAPTAAGWDQWRAPEPCKKLTGGGTVPGTKIGDQDGIRASMNRLRVLDPGGTIVPQGQTIDDLTQPVSSWKAWDKLERTLQILKDDHDINV